MTHSEACAMRKERVEAARRMFENLKPALEPFGDTLIREMVASIDNSLTVAHDTRGNYDVVAVEYPMAEPC